MRKKTNIFPTSAVTEYEPQCRVSAAAESESGQIIIHSLDPKGRRRMWNRQRGHWGLIKLWYAIIYILVSCEGAEFNI